VDGRVGLVIITHLSSRPRPHRLNNIYLTVGGGFSGELPENGQDGESGTTNWDDGDGMHGQLSLLSGGTRAESESSAFHSKVTVSALSSSGNLGRGRRHDEFVCGGRY